MFTQSSRIQIKYSNVTGVIPTIPITSDHTDGTWLPTDLYVGEIFLNAQDDLAWIRTNNGIIPIAGSGGAYIADYVSKSSGGTYSADVFGTLFSATTIYGDNVNGIDANFTGDITATQFIGDGSLLTGITATWNGGIVTNLSVFQQTVTFENGIATNTITPFTGTTIDLNGNITVDNINSSGDITATSFYGDGSNLTGIPGLGNDYTTSATLDGTIIKFTRTDLTNAYEVDLSSITGPSIQSTSWSGATNQLTITLTDASIINLNISTFNNISVTGSVTADFFIGDGSGLTNLPSTIGALNDLTNVNIIAPNNNDLLTYDTLTGKWINKILDGNISSFTNDAGYLINTDLSTVAFSGDYNDLINTPIIPGDTNIGNTNLEVTPGQNRTLKLGSSSGSDYFSFLNTNNVDLFRISNGGALSNRYTFANGDIQDTYIDFRGLTCHTKTTVGFWARSTEFKNINPLSDGVSTNFGLFGSSTATSYAFWSIGTSANINTNNGVALFPTGNISIGTYSQSDAKLRIVNTIAQPSLIVEDSTTPDTTSFVIDENGSVSIGAAKTYLTSYKLDVFGTINTTGFRMNTGSALNRVFISSDANGLGAWSDLKTVNGNSILGSGNISISSTNIANSDLTISSTGTRKLIFGGANSTDILAFRNSTDTADLFRVQGNGNVIVNESTGTFRIGTSDTSYNFIVTNLVGGKLIRMYDTWGSNTIYIDGYNSLISSSTFKTNRTTNEGVVLDSISSVYRLKFEDQFGTVGTRLQYSGSTNLGDYYFKSGSENGTVFFKLRSNGIGFDNNVVVNDRACIGIGGETFGTNAKYVIGQFNGTAPSTSIADAYQQYSADIVAGNAAPHFRTENGSIVKLYQESAVTTVQGLANALTNLGLLASSTVTVSGTNIANSDLTISSTGTRKLIFAGAASTDILAFRNSTDTLSILEVRGDNKVVFGNSLTNYSIVVSNTAYGKQLSSYDSFSTLKYRLDTDEGRIYASSQILVASVDGTGDGIKLIKGAGGARNIKIDDQFSTNYFDISVNTSTALSTFYLRTASDNNNVFTTFRSAGVGYDHNLTISNRASLAIGGTTFDTGSKYTLNMFNGTAPTTNIIDAFQQYSADATANNAAPHFRTEAGDVVKLYKYVNAALANTANTGDANTDALIEALKTLVTTLGLGASA